MSTPPLIFDHPEHGFLAFGVETEDGEVQRKKHCQLAGGNGASLRIFEDGGWELRSKSSDLGCNLIAKGGGGLHIYSEGDLKIQAGKKLTLSAQDIVMESTAQKGDIICRPSHDFRVEAKNNVKILGTMGALIFDHRMILASKGATFIRGMSIRMIEPRSKLIPTSLKEFAEGIINEFLLPGG